VRELAAKLLERYPRIDVLANNAGGIFHQRQITEDGHEKTLQVNHLAGFLLTWLLRERLESAGAAVIDTSSDAHRMARIDLEDLESSRRYSAWRAYGSTKLMNILHAAEINKRLRGVRGVSFHPGVVATGFAREGNAITRAVYNKVFSKLFMISPEAGADTLVWLAMTDGWQPGEYYVKRKSGRRKNAAARDAGLAARLWDASARMTSVASR
jgi:NAD(P)-dependent dehydrogenase (short-subunit alcohol dehydrogenase family)